MEEGAGVSGCMSYDAAVAQVHICVKSLCACRREFVFGTLGQTAHAPSFSPMTLRAWRTRSAPPPLPRRSTRSSLRRLPLPGLSFLCLCRYTYTRPARAAAMRL